jgi:hypothetical protein
MKKKFTVEEAKEIGEKLGVKWDKFDVEEFRKGMDIELEHGTVNSVTNVTNDDPLLTGKITLVHLNEIRDYNTRLLKMEEEGEKYWEEKEKEKGKNA